MKNTSKHLSDGRFTACMGEESGKDIQRVFVAETGFGI